MIIFFVFLKNKNSYLQSFLRTSRPSVFHSIIGFAKFQRKSQTDPNSQLTVFNLVFGNRYVIFPVMTLSFSSHIFRVLFFESVQIVLCFFLPSREISTRLFHLVCTLSLSLLYVCILFSRHSFFVVLYPQYRTSSSYQSESHNVKTLSLEPSKVFEALTCRI